MKHETMGHNLTRLSSRVIFVAILLTLNLLHVRANAETVTGAYDEMRTVILRLGYSDQVADDFVNMISEWKDADGNRSVTEWFRVISDAERKRENEVMAKSDLARIQLEVAGAVYRKILKEIKISEDIDEYFLIDDVVKDKEMLCLGYAQVYYVIANSLGIKTRVIRVLGYAPIYAATSRLGHVACISILDDKRTLIADYYFLSRPFRHRDLFEKKGPCWELKDHENPLELHTRIEILDEDGIKAQVQLNLGRRHEKAGELRKALEYYTRSAKLSPTFASAHVNSGGIYDQLGVTEKALAEYNKALELDPSSPSAYCSRGTLFDGMGEYGKAVADYTRAIDLRPEMAMLYCNRANTYARMREYAKAFRDYEKTLDLDGNYLGAYYNRANLYFDTGKHDKAIQDYTRAIELKPGYAEAYINRGMSYVKTGRKPLAVKDLRKAVQLDSSWRDWVEGKAEEHDLELDLE